ncbi:hypothetical protein CO172_00605 [Candidatus Uhrbacteria bacterium CG_4_9_14_3_um_filter_36_7]|uniref:DAGKc domain-containing protein n=1 Tax=Candidatus Uhrbacteria bacterium CG_4_9_14_3_um_filter_36_7 TaxID=1975033 RepID=A0A2M7XI75_9BACT|nr:MAG: hypothetical protein CO172_00605 [Candidatus Uhrbacteria bacterium CG_4_9_14_3_um_filter_36_7]
MEKEEDMYYYIYDECVQDRRYEKELLKIENRLADLGLTGNIARLALFRRADEFIRDEIRRGVTTVVVVGNDETVYKILDVIADEKLVFGMIPLGPYNDLANLLGIPQGMAACDILSSRVIQTIDTGMLNGRRFIANVKIPQSMVEIICEGKYRICPKKEGNIEIRNLAPGVLEEGEAICSNPCDGLLETVIKVQNDVRHLLRRHRKVEVTNLPLRSVLIKSQEPLTVFVDGKEMQGTRFDITVEPMTLRVITGKQRVF